MDVWPTPGFWHPSLLPSLPRLLPSHPSGDGDSPMVIVGFLPRTYLKHRMKRFELSSSCGLLIVLQPSPPRHMKAKERRIEAIDEEICLTNFRLAPTFLSVRSGSYTSSGQTAVDQRQRWRQMPPKKPDPVRLAADICAIPAVLHEDGVGFFLSEGECAQGGTWISGIRVGGGRDWDPRRGAIWRPQWAGAVRPRDVIPGRDLL